MYVLFSIVYYLSMILIYFTILFYKFYVLIFAAQHVMPCKIDLKMIINLENNKLINN